MDKQSLQNALRILSQTIDALSQEEIDALFAGSGKLVFVSSETLRQTPVQPQPAPMPAPPQPGPETAQATPAKSKQKPSAKSPAVDLDDLWARLIACRDRSEAKALLSAVKSKRTLTDLGKAQKVSLKSSDHRDLIENRLIEIAIGVALRRNAIHSLDMKEPRRTGSD